MTKTPERPELRCTACHHPVLIEQFNDLVGACARCNNKTFEPVDGVEFIPYSQIESLNQATRYFLGAENRFREAVARLGGYHIIMANRFLRYSLVELAREVYHQETP